MIKETQDGYPVVPRKSLNRSCTRGNFARGGSQWTFRAKNTRRAIDVTFPLGALDRAITSLSYCMMLAKTNENLWTRQWVVQSRRRYTSRGVPLTPAALFKLSFQIVRESRVTLSLSLQHPIMLTLSSITFVCFVLLSLQSEFSRPQIRPSFYLEHDARVRESWLDWRCKLEQV